MNNNSSRIDDSILAISKLEDFRLACASKGIDPILARKERQKFQSRQFAARKRAKNRLQKQHDCQEMEEDENDKGSDSLNDITTTTTTTTTFETCAHAAELRADDADGRARDLEISLLDSEAHARDQDFRLREAEHKIVLLQSMCSFERNRANIYEEQITKMRKNESLLTSMLNMCTSTS